ncbi:MAG: glycosyltransferase family 39 protein [Ginsengibacter sp.]
MTKKTIILADFILLKFLLQYFFLNVTYDLHRDEYLHLDQANHLAWGYQSVPPVTSWISYIIKFLGNSEWLVKFFPALFGALTIVVVWKAIEALKGNLFALILGATCVLFSALLRLNFLFQPTSLDVLCWTTLYFIFIKYILSGKDKYLLIGSLVFAIGFLNKYDIVFLLIGLFPAILLSEQRKIFTKRKLYAAILVGFLLISPNLLWQYNNGFPVFHHLKELATTQLVYVRRWDFLKEQLFYFIGSLPVIMASLYAFIFYKPFKKYRLFFWTIIFTLVVFVYLKAKGYYALGLYPIYISFGSVFLGNILKTGWKKHLRPIAIAIPVSFYFILFNTFFSNKNPAYVIENEKAYKILGLLRWEDGKNHSLPQDFADMLGWKELAQKVDSIYLKMPNEEHTLVLCDNYGQAGAINYYTKLGIKAVSFNADYVDWFKPDQQYINLIRVKASRERDNEMKETSPFFRTSVLADSIANQYAREYKTMIFSFTGAKIDINKRIEIEIMKTKNYRQQQLKYR